jgi:hypothetical protein
MRIRILLERLHYLMTAVALSAVNSGLVEMRYAPGADSALYWTIKPEAAPKAEA